MFQHRMLKHPKFQALSPNANKVLFFLAAQYNGKNNGDLTAAWKIAKDRGFTSNGALHSGIKELEAAGFIVLTRQGGRNRCSLYALSWFPIHDCGGKLDHPPTRTPPYYWLRDDKSCAPPVVQCEPDTVQSEAS